MHGWEFNNLVWRKIIYIYKPQSPSFFWNSKSKVLLSVTTFAFFIHFLHWSAFFFPSDDQSSQFLIWLIPLYSTMSHSASLNVQNESFFSPFFWNYIDEISVVMCGNKYTTFRTTDFPLYIDFFIFLLSLAIYHCTSW